MTGKVLDAAYPRWTLAQLVAWRDAGRLAGVMSYLSWLPNGKVITRDRFGALEHAGIDQGLVWESNGTDFAQGLSAGLRDGAEARRQATVLGWPAERPLYSTVDTGAHASEAARLYQHGFGAGQGFYGDRDIADDLIGTNLIGWYWQTNARGWPGDALDDPRAVMVQRTSKSFPELAPGSYDESDVFAADWGQHPAPAGATPVPLPPIVTASIHLPEYPELTMFTDIPMKLDTSGRGHVPVPGVKASQCGAVTGIAVEDPERLGHYLPIPTTNITIGKDGNAEIVVEGGIPSGPATVRVLHG